MFGQSQSLFIRLSLFLVLITIGLNCKTVSAQATFQRTLGTAANEFGTGVIQLANGNLLILCQVPEPGSTDKDFCLVLTNSGGSIISSKRYYLPGNQVPVSLVESVDGGFIIAGDDYNSANRRLFILKMNQNFDVEWTKLVSHNVNLQLYLIIEDPQSNIYIGADSRPTGSTSDIVLLKMDASGNELWHRSWDYGNNDHIYGIHIAPDGNIYFAGSSFLSLADLTFTCVSSNGVIRWEKSICQDQSYFPRGIIELDNDEFLIFGRALSLDQSFAIRMDNTFTPIWSKMIGKSGGHLEFEDGCFYNGTIFLFGDSNTNSGDIDFWCMNIDGTINWAKSYGSDFKESIPGLAQSSIFPGSDGMYIIANTEGFGSGLTDLYLIKTDLSGNSGCNEQDIQTFESPISYSPYNISGASNLDVNVNDAQIIGVENYNLNLTTLCPLELQANFTSSTQNICVDQAIDFTDLSQNNPNSWLWLFEGGIPAFSTDQNPKGVLYPNPGSFDVTLIVSDGSDMDTLEQKNYINVAPQAEVNLGDDQSLCNVGTIVLDIGLGYSSYSWSTGSTSQWIIVDEPGKYWVTVTNTTGCVGSDTINITNNTPIPLNLGEDQSICNGGEIVLDAGMGYSTYIWSDGSTGQKIIADEPGTYWITVTNAAGCSGSDTINIVNDSPPPVDLGVDIQICTGSNATLGIAENYEQYFWSTGETTPEIVVSIPGDYWLKVINAGGCENSDTVSIFNFAGPSFESIVFPSGGKMIVNGSGGNPPYEYALQNQIFQSENEFENLIPGEYLVFIRDINNCVNDTVAIVPEVELKIPNFFTPNSDNIHDTWEIEGISQYPKSEIQIFDRYGKLLIRYEGSEKGWDGKYMNQPAPSDTYWYQISLFDGKPPVAGDVTIKR